MDKKILDIIGAFISIIIGGVLLVFREALANFAVQAWFKRFNIKISETPYKIFLLLIGTLFLLSGIITFKKFFFK